jgi:hypothetical protein
LGSSGVCVSKPNRLNESDAAMSVSNRDVKLLMEIADCKTNPTEPGSSYEGAICNADPVPKLPPD